MQTTASKKLSAPTDPKEILSQALTEKLSANPLYSLRAFARDLKISPQHLSNIMNGRKGLSVSAAKKIALYLEMNSQETHYFLELVKSHYARSETCKKIALKKIKSIKQTYAATAHLNIDLFRVVSDWYHLALVELLKIQSDHEPKHLAKILGIQEIEVKQAFERLIRLELISLKTKNYYEVKSELIFATDGIPSSAIRKYHKQILEKAIHSIEGQSIDKRYLSTSLASVRLDSIPIIRDKIKQFREEMIQEFGVGKNGEDIVALSIQLFSLTNHHQTTTKGEQP